MYLHKLVCYLLKQPQYENMSKFLNFKLSILNYFY